MTCNCCDCEQIPEAVLDKNSPSWNQGRAWIDGARKDVVEEYAKQSEEDLKSFLRCRAEEMVSGGLLFILMAGRSDSEHPENQLGDPDSRAKHPFTNAMDQAWNDLVKENLINEETRDASVAGRKLEGCSSSARRLRLNPSNSVE